MFCLVYIHLHCRAIRLLILGDIVAARGFHRDYLFIEYRWQVDTSVWSVAKESEASLRGATVISRGAWYPADPWEGRPEEHVAHFSHPMELELNANRTPQPGKWPYMVFRVSGEQEGGQAFLSYTCVRLRGNA